MMLGLKSGPQIAEKTGIPAGLLCRRIWYPVWKSGVLGITEYRQGRPLTNVRDIKNEILKVAPPVHNSNTKLQWVEAYTFCTRTLTTKTSFRSPPCIVQTWCRANVSVVGKLNADLIAIIKYEVRSRTFQAHNPRHWRSHTVQNKQDNNHSSSASLRTSTD